MHKLRINTASSSQPSGPPRICITMASIGKGLPKKTRASSVPGDNNRSSIRGCCCRFSLAVDVYRQNTAAADEETEKETEKEMQKLPLRRPAEIRRRPLTRPRSQLDLAVAFDVTFCYLFRGSVLICMRMEKIDIWSAELSVVGAAASSC